MSDTAFRLVLGFGLLILTMGVRAASLNRLVRRKLRLALVLLAAYIGVSAVVGQIPLSAELAARVLSVNQLFLALALINLTVVVLINPLRVDRIPEHFPNIVQDTLVIGLFALVATFVFREKVLTTSAVGAVVVGFALQDTLGNMFAGLAIQIEKPFRVGHWVSVGPYEGAVHEVTWRATKIRTKTGNLVVLPNSFISKEAITNYSEPEVPTRLDVEVGVHYEVPPNRVKAVILEAVGGLPSLLPLPPPDVVVTDFGASAMIYRVRFWTNDFARDAVVRDEVRSAIYYALRRNRYEIPYPMQIRYSRTDKPDRIPERSAEIARVLAGIDLFASLTDDQRAQLAAGGRELIFGSGQTVVRQDDAGSSMFIVCEGRVRVVEASGRELAVIVAPGYVGEMSMLTGQARSASVYASGECVLVELTADALRAVALATPGVLERISTVVATRRADLERQKAEAAAVAPHPIESPRSLLTRIQAFLGLD